MRDALGSKKARKAQAYYNHQEAKWDPTKQSIVDFHRYLTSLEETFSTPISAPISDEFLYYQLWRQVPRGFREKLTSTNKPKIQDAIVRAIEELELDRKQDRSKSDAAKQSGSKCPRHDKPHNSNSNPRKDQGRSAGADNTSEAAEKEAQAFEYGAKHPAL